MDRLKQTLAYVLYYTGHWVSFPMSKFDLGWLYPFYNWCMIKSGDFDVKERIWQRPQEEQKVS